MLEGSNGASLQEVAQLKRSKEPCYCEEHTPLQTLISFWLDHLFLVPCIFTWNYIRKILGFTQFLKYYPPKNTIVQYPSQV